MARGKLPRRTITTGSGPTSKGAAVGTGVKGGKFHNIRRFNAAVAMAKKAGRKGPTPASGPGSTAGRKKRVSGLPKLGTHRKKFGRGTGSN